MQEQNQYTEDNIRSLDWKEHIRMRPGMFTIKIRLEGKEYILKDGDLIHYRFNV
jgi:ribosome-binding ATPase YchF (GTP1/OBG family)